MKHFFKNTRVLLPIYLTVFAFGAFAARLPSAVNAESPKLEVDGYCSRGDLLVYESATRARCVKLRDLRVDSCDSGAFLTAQNGQIRCVGPSSTPWGAEGLLPRCSRDEIVVSEGFGKWKCAQQSRSDK